MHIFCPVEIQNSGLFMNFWKMDSVVVNYPARTIHCRLAGWGSEELYKTGKSSFMRIEVAFLLTEWGYTESSLYHEVLLKSRTAAQKSVTESTEIDGLPVSPLLEKGTVCETVLKPFAKHYMWYSGAGDVPPCDTEEAAIKLGLASSD